MEENNKTFQDRLKSCRLSFGLSQESVARAVDVTVRNYSKWEHGIGYPSFNSIIALCSLFHVSADYLLCLSDTPEKLSDV